MVIGTRPEAIKLAPVARALRHCGIAPTIVQTGQHPALELDAQGFEGLPLLRLGCPPASDPHVFVGLVTRRLLPFLDECDMVVVQGDTSSALGGALAGAQAGIPVAHVEAGLRTHDRSNPWPEEDFRIAIDSYATLLFAPTEVSAANLRSEGVGGLVEVTGNTAVDALLEAMAELAPRERAPDSKRRLLITCHRRESWGEGLDGIAAALIDLAQSEAVEIDFILHPNPQVAGQMRWLLEGVDGIRLGEPCSHLEMLRRMRDCDLLLSDSGGMQEEAPTLGVPILVLRDATERPEGVAAGNARLVGRDPSRIIAEVRDLLADPEALSAMARPSMPYGDGKAAQRIARSIHRWLEQSDLGAEPQRLRA